MSVDELDKRALFLTLKKLVGRLVLYVAVLLALGIVVVSACTETQAQPSPSPSRPTATASRTPAATTSSPTPAPTASPSASPASTPTSTASPGSSPAAACPHVTGGTTGAQVQLTAIRIAHQPGFDRLVFEFGPSTAPGPFAMPQYAVDPATSLSGASGQPATITGNALFGVRVQNASTRTPSGTASYAGSTDLQPGTPLIKEVKLVDDFERVMLWGAGLDHLACPKVSELAAPFRLVLDFPTPP